MLTFVVDITQTPPRGLLGATCVGTGRGRSQHSSHIPGKPFPASCSRGRHWAVLESPGTVGTRQCLAAAARPAPVHAEPGHTLLPSVFYSVTCGPLQWHLAQCSETLAHLMQNLLILVNPNAFCERHFCFPNSVPFCFSLLASHHICLLIQCW